MASMGKKEVLGNKFMNVSAQRNRRIEIENKGEYCHKRDFSKLWII